MRVLQRGSSVNLCYSEEWTVYLGIHYSRYESVSVYMRVLQ